MAARDGCLEILRTLINNDALVNAPIFTRFGATALQYAAIGGYIGIAESLLAHSAEVNAPGGDTEHGRTALEGAAEHGRIDMLKLLANAGANLYGKGYKNALQLARTNGHRAAERYLKSLATLPS
ncbi:MAG: hypothetical protein Q9161_004043 [Pseudevernia consocians]